MDKKTKKTIRNRIIAEIWAREKNSITMKDLADIFNIPLASFYRIIKNNKKK